MSLEKLAISFGEHVDRRRFLRRGGVATLTAVGAMFGMKTGTATAGGTGLQNIECCNLCFPDSGSCSNCVSVWCWNCCVRSQCVTGQRIHCCECYSIPNGSGNCTGAICSYLMWGYDCPKCQSPAP